MTGDIHYKRTAMPVSKVRKMNEGVKASISKTEAETDACIQIVSRSYVDMAMLQVMPDKTKYLQKEAKPHIAIMGEDLVYTLFYGNNASGVLGLGTRYSKLNGDKKRQIINFGGTANLTSVFIVKWDRDEVTGIYPQNTTAGISITAQSNVLVPDKENNTFLAHMTEYSQFFGLKVRDPRYVARLCNIPMDSILTDETARQKLFELLITTKNRIHHVSEGRVVMYMSPDLHNVLEVAAFTKTNTIVGYKDGMTSDTRILTFSGIPIRRNEFMLEPEVLVD
jgi:hypothetical protein